jgi:hypothetical protein
VSQVTGDWTTYEDIVQRFNPLSRDGDFAPGDRPNNFIGFNNIKTIEDKVAAALQLGLGGVMIWEVGQDCRLVATQRSGVVHGVTCPTQNSSLLVAVTNTIQQWKEIHSRKSIDNIENEF